MTDGASNDWRLTNQEEYLAGVTLVRRRYRQYERDPSWDHDHCAFCWDTFSLAEPDAVREGYATTDDYHWICSGCFEDFRLRFRWEVVDASDG